MSEIMKGSLSMPQRAISINQPWAGLIVHGWKDVENRSWPTKVRGWVFIHASAVFKLEQWQAARALVDAKGLAVPREAVYPARGPGQEFGGIVGIAEIVDCVTECDSPWFVGEYGFVLRNARRIPFHACRGKLGFFSVSYPQAVWEEVAGEVVSDQ